jgi:hypothetical protein
LILCGCCLSSCCFFYLFLPTSINNITFDFCHQAHGHHFQPPLSITANTIRPIPDICICNLHPCYHSPQRKRPHQHGFHTNSSSQDFSSRLSRWPLQSQTVYPRLQTKDSQSDQELLLVDREHQRLNGFHRQTTNPQSHSPSPSSTRGRARRQLIWRRLQIGPISLPHSLSQASSSPSQLQPAPSLRSPTPTQQLVTTNKWRLNWENLTHRCQLLPQETLQPHH